MKKNIVKLNENTLRQIVAESVKKVLKENQYMSYEDTDAHRERNEKSAIIFYCEDNFGKNYKYVRIAEKGEEQEVISKEEKLSTEIYDYEIVSCFV